MKHDHANLISLLTDLEEQEVLREVRKLLAAGDKPLRILESCQEGMRHVGEHYDRGRYYISGLIMAGEIMRQVADQLRLALENSVSADASGRAIIGTVRGDIHDIGKNFFKMLLRCYGFEVLDLGVDVSPSDFLEHCKQFEPDIIGMSALLTVSYDSLHETIAMLRKGLPNRLSHTPTIIGGGVINDKVRRQVKANYWAHDAIAGVKICKRIVSRNSL